MQATGVCGHDHPAAVFAPHRFGDPQEVSDVCPPSMNGFEVDVRGGGHCANGLQDLRGQARRSFRV